MATASIRRIWTRSSPGSANCLPHRAAGSACRLCGPLRSVMAGGLARPIPHQVSKSQCRCLLQTYLSLPSGADVRDTVLSRVRECWPSGASPDPMNTSNTRSGRGTPLRPCVGRGQAVHHSVLGALPRCVAIAGIVLDVGLSEAIRCSTRRVFRDELYARDQAILPATPRRQGRS